MELLAILLIAFMVVVFLIILLYFLLQNAKHRPEVQKVHRNLDELKQRIGDFEKQGLQETEIAGKLKAVGWKEHVVELVIHDLHKPSHALDRLQDYAEKQKMKAVPDEIIKETLLESGWNEDLVDVVLDVKTSETGQYLALKEKKTSKQKQKEKEQLKKVKEKAETEARKQEQRMAAEG